MRLTLPLPPSPNQWPSHHLAHHRAKFEYQRRAWLRAIQQHRPLRDPPRHVRVVAVLHHTGQPRDQDNAVASLKWALDALKQRQAGALRWRQNAYDLCGYFIDDDPEHLMLASVGQHRVRRRDDRRLELEITDLRKERAA